MVENRAKITLNAGRRNKKFCGDYLEANAWSAEEKQLYQRFLQKRAALAEIEREAIEVLAESTPDR
jgi:hypothetical protein